MIACCLLMKLFVNRKEEYRMTKRTKAYYRAQRKISPTLLVSCYFPPTPCPFLSSPEIYFPHQRAKRPSPLSWLKKKKGTPKPSQGKLKCQASLGLIRGQPALGNFDLRSGLDLKVGHVVFGQGIDKKSEAQSGVAPTTLVWIIVLVDQLGLSWAEPSGAQSRPSLLWWVWIVCSSTRVRPKSKVWAH